MHYKHSTRGSGILILSLCSISTSLLSFAVMASPTASTGIHANTRQQASFNHSANNSPLMLAARDQDEQRGQRGQRSREWSRSGYNSPDRGRKQPGYQGNKTSGGDSRPQNYRDRPQNHRPERKQDSRSSSQGSGGSKYSERRSNVSVPNVEREHKYRDKYRQQNPPRNGSRNESTYKKQKNPVPRRSDSPKSDRDGRDSRYQNKPNLRERDQRYSKPGRDKPIVRKPQPPKTEPRRIDHDRNHKPRPEFRHEEPRPRVIKQPSRRHEPMPKYRLYKRERYIYYRTPWYNTRIFAPIRHEWLHVGHRVHFLPHSHIRIVVGSIPFFYFSGVFYRSFESGYVVVSAPIGAIVHDLPVGFIAFTLGALTYYYVNDTYYRWYPDEDAFVVVEKPVGAEQAIDDQTRGRLFIYPNAGQSEEQQARDRYECHEWAVSESGIDPTDEEATYSGQQYEDYKLAMKVCLEERDYTVR